MKIAVTCDENQAIAENLLDAEWFKIYEIENGAIKDSELVHTINAGHKIIAPFLADKDVEALICGFADGQAKRIYARFGLILYSKKTGLAQDIIDKFISGEFDYE